MHKFCLKNIYRLVLFALFIFAVALPSLATAEDTSGFSRPKTAGEYIVDVLTPKGDKDEKLYESSDKFKKALSELGRQIRAGNVPDNAKFNEEVDKIIQQAPNVSVSGTAQQFNDYFSNCMVCHVFGVIFDSINELSYAVWERSKFAFISLLGVLLAIWLVFRFGSAISSLVPISPADFWREIGLVLMKVVFVVAILSFGIGDFIGAYIVSPVVYGASSFTEAIVQSYNNINPFSDKLKDIDMPSVDKGAFMDVYSGGENTLTGKNEPTSFGEKRKLAMEYADRLDSDELKNLVLLIEFTKDENQKKKLQDILMRSILSNTTSADGIISCSGTVLQEADKTMNAAIEKELELKQLAAGKYAEGSEELKYSTLLTAGARVHGILNIGTKAAFMCMIESMNKELAFGKGVGASLMKYGLTAYKLPIVFSWTIGVPDFVVITAGFLIWLACFVLTLIFSFKLLDACFRLGILSMLMPLLLIAFVFPSTKDYAKRGVTTLVQIACIFVILSILLALSVLLIMEAFQFGLPNIDPANNTINVPGGTVVDFFIQHQRADIYTLYNKGDIEGINEQFNLTTRSFLGGLACIIFAVLCLSMVDSTAAEFSGLGFGGAIGDKAGAITTKGAMGVGQMGIRGAKLGYAALKSNGKKGGQSGESKASSASFAAESGPSTDTETFESGPNEQKETRKPEEPKPETPKPEEPKPEEPKSEEPKPEEPKPEESKSEQQEEPKSNMTEVRDSHQKIQDKWKQQQGENNDEKGKEDDAKSPEDKDSGSGPKPEKGDADDNSVDNVGVSEETSKKVDDTFEGKDISNEYKKKEDATTEEVNRQYNAGSAGNTSPSESTSADGTSSSDGESS